MTGAELLDVVRAAVESAGDTITDVEAIGLIRTALARLGHGPAACSRCGQFLSAIRVEMRIDRCAKCDGHGSRRRG